MVWRPDDPQGNEAAKIKHLIVPYTRGQGLDLGCGPWKAYPHFIGVDSGKDYGRRVTDVSHVCERLPMFADRGLHFVFSSHLLEHITDYEAALKEWWRLIEPDGHLILYLPHKSHYPNIGQDGANPDHKHDFTQADIVNAMQRVAAASGWGWMLVEDEARAEDNEYSFFQVYRKNATEKRKCIEVPWRKPDKALLLIRYGAWGDHLMVSSALPKLKAQGWHITYNTIEKGQEILAEDPHVDAFLLQDKDQVPNGELTAYWAALSKRYDRTINLSESIEGSLLGMPGRREHAWPEDVRRTVLGRVNYVERTHDLCGVEPTDIRPRFYPSAEDRKWAREMDSLARYGTKAGRKVKPNAKPHPTVMWVLSGSGLHKVYPYLDMIVARLMETTDARVYLVGDAWGQMLEAGWENEPRVFQRAAKDTITQTLALAQMCDVVVGPETGVMNAVSAEESVRKVVFLSHSSHENLTKHWVNTAVMEPVETSCFPCHRMHYTWEHCRHVKELGVSLCAANIDPERTIKEIMAGLPARAREVA